MSETDKKTELAELARRAADGERDAINAIMKRYTGELYFYTRMYNGDRETARGCVQAAIRTILSRIRECSESPDPEKWMRDIVTAEALALNLPIHAENLEAVDDAVGNGFAAVGTVACLNDEGLLIEVGFLP